MRRFVLVVRICSIASCGNPLYSRDWCERHYGRWYRTGTPEGGVRKPPPPRSASLAEAFAWYRPGDPPPKGTVWPWLGPTTRQNYGTMCWRHGIYVAHRLSYELFVGPIPSGVLIRHKNDTPIDVNPNNLEPGTPKQNSQDALERNRFNPPRGEANGHSKLTEELVLEIRYRRNELGESCHGIARDLNICHQSVSNIARRKSWQHVK